jgi:hypothetical protein
VPVAFGIQIATYDVTVWYKYGVRRSSFPRPLYTPFDGPMHTLYAELVERTRSEAALLPGTPGSLSLRRRGEFGNYWYRRYYHPPSQPTEKWVCREEDRTDHARMSERIEAARWVEQRVSTLRKLGFQVATKDAACVLVEMHNKGLLAAGLVVMGTHAFMAWLNEFGTRAVASSTQDLHQAKRKPLTLAMAVPLPETLTATELECFEIPGLRPGEPATSAKRAGKDGLRVELLTSSPKLGRSAPGAGLKWHAKTVRHFDYLLHKPQQAAILAGSHCIPVQLPDAPRMAWHKLHSSTDHTRDRAKAERDLWQAAVLLAALVERDSADIGASLAVAPGEVQQAVHRRWPVLRELLAAHPQAQEELHKALARLG